MAVGVKLRTTLFALVILIVCGGVGVFLTASLAKIAAGSWTARDWVLVQAKVDQVGGGRIRSAAHAAGAYRYSVGGKEYVGTRLAFDIGGADNLGDWQESMTEFLAEAQRTGKTIPVYVNPADPADSVVDRNLRWGMFAIIGFFAVVFDAIGIGALWTAITAWRDERPRASPRAETKAAPGKPSKYGPMIGNVIVGSIFLVILAAIGGCVRFVVGTFQGS